MLCFLCTKPVLIEVYFSSQKPLKHLDFWLVICVQNLIIFNTKIQFQSSFRPLFCLILKVIYRLKIWPSQQQTLKILESYQPY